MTPGAGSHKALTVRVFTLLLASPSSISLISSPAVSPPTARGSRFAASAFVAFLPMHLHLAANRGNVSSPRSGSPPSCCCSSATCTPPRNIVRAKAPRPPGAPPSGSASSLAWGCDEIPGRRALPRRLARLSLCRPRPARFRNPPPRPGYRDRHRRRPPHLRLVARAQPAPLRRPPRAARLPQRLRGSAFPAVVHAQVRPHAALLRPPRRRLDLRQHPRRLRPASTATTSFSIPPGSTKSPPPSFFAIIGFIAYLKREKLAAWQRQSWWLAGLLGLLLLAGFIRFNFSFFQAQARYLFPALPAAAVALPSAWNSFSPSLRSLGLPARRRGAPGLSLLGPLLLDRAALPAGKSRPRTF